MDYKKHIGDGKFPNKYWVFQADEKFKRMKEGEYCTIECIKEADKVDLLRKLEEIDKLTGFIGIRGAMYLSDDKLQEFVNKLENEVKK